MAGLSVSGLISGLKTDEIIQKLQELEQRPILQYQSQQNTLRARLAAYQQANTRLLAVRDAASDLATPSYFGQRTVVSSKSELATATSEAGATSGEYTISVESVARAHQVLSQRYADLNSTEIGSGTLSITAGGKTTTVTVDSSNNTLAKLRDSINAANGSIRASIVQDGDSSYRLMVSSKETGTANALTINSSIAGGTAPVFTDLQAAEDALVKLGSGPGALSVTRSTNSVRDLIPGGRVSMESFPGTLKTSIQRLSSGLRVNSASDDPAGLVISQQMRAQSEGLGQAVRNANDGINLAKTAEAALNEVHSLLTQMRTLAVHASNTGANSTEAIAADQAQLDKAVESIDRIASGTKFNGLALLDGTYSGKVFQVGANASDTVSLSITNQNASTLAVSSLNLSSGAGAAITAIDAAINTVSSTRSTLGSFQRNTLESTVNSLSIARENIRSAESTIRDADVAAEMVTFTRNNIMLQAGTAMLAQANMGPQTVLQLLR